MGIEHHGIWNEKYRPTSLDTYIGNEHLKSKVSIFIETNDPPHLLFYGRAGTGKTTLSKIITKSIECEYLYINASDENSVDTVRDKVKGFASTLGFQSLKVIILDECDYITPNAQAALRNLMETFSRHCRFILTCNYVERIIDPIQSRCQSFQIVPPSKKEVAVHLSEILTNENVKFEVDDIATIINGAYPDIRKVINTSQRQVVDGILRMDAREIILNDYKLQILEVLKSSKSKKETFTEIRQILADAKVSDFADFFRLLYDEVDSYGSGHIAEVILLIAKYEQSDSQVVDKEINAMAMLIEILQEVR
ncbi:AAA family ATPase [Candidatus Woesearchaeota archaeon]|nr:AAA family ATPase [Candidatus Woesearchaeota archaeon]MBT7555303.1 AAA family ATPase [Candidatus Woesearchaeota archaeon]